MIFNLLNFGGVNVYYFFLYLYIYNLFLNVLNCIVYIYNDRFINVRGEYFILMLLYYFICRNYICIIFLIRGIFYVGREISGCMN